MAKTSLKTFRLANFGGGINSVAEVNALNSFDYNGQGVLCEAEDCENWEPTNRGGLRKVGGFSVYANIATGANNLLTEGSDQLITEGSDHLVTEDSVGASTNPITGIYRYTKASGTSYFLVSSGTNLYTVSGGTGSSIFSSLTNNAYTHFETANDLCVICDGTIEPRTYNGTTVAELCAGAGDSTAVTGARQSLWYQNRLWVFGNTSNPSLLYYSDAGAIGTGYSSNFVNCDVNDGQKITAIAKFFIAGQLEPVIVVGKERSIGIVTGDGSTGNPYTFVKINQDAGIPGFRQIVQFGQDVAYLTPKGVSSYQTDNQNINLPFKFLSEKVRNRFQELNQTTLDDALCWYDWKKSRIAFAVPEEDQTTPNVIWHYDIRLGGWYKERWNTGQDCTAAFIDTDGTLYHGDSNGIVYAHLATDKNFNGGAITAFYKTPYLDFGSPAQYKRIVAGLALVRGGGVFQIGMGTYLDWGVRTGKTNTLRVEASSSTWGSFTWGSFTWGASTIKRKKFHPSGRFQAIQFVLTNSTANQSVDLFELQFHVESSSHI